MVPEEDAALSATLKVFRVVSFHFFLFSFTPFIPLFLASPLFLRVIHDPPAHLLCSLLCSLLIVLSQDEIVSAAQRWLRYTPRPPRPRIRRCSWCPRTVTTTRGSGLDRSTSDVCAASSTRTPVPTAAAAAPTRLALRSSSTAPHAHPHRVAHLAMQTLHM